MRRYWKIGSRWDENGDMNTSILDIFLANSIVFVKEINTKGRMMSDVKVNDVIAITDGTEIVATAVVTTPPSYLKYYLLNLTPRMMNVFDYDYEKYDTIAVKVDFVKTNIKIPYRQGAFCEILDSGLQAQLP